MTASEHEPARALSDAQIQQFIQDGFVRIDRAFPRKFADEAREIMWRDLPCDPDDPATWTKPVTRLPGYGQEPFSKAVNTPILHAAFDQIVGKGRWRPRDGLGLSGPVSASTRSGRCRLACRSQLPRRRLRSK
jgi:hypothetical protein